MSGLFATLVARGLVQDATPAAEARLNGPPVSGYVGFDPTAPSLHVGNLVPVMCLAWLQRSGGTPYALVGGGTGLVGDPSGKRSERPMLEPGEVAENAGKLTGQLRRFLSFDGSNAARVVDNAEWLGELRLMDFLRDAGKHFTVNYMLQKESVKSRMETGISFTEFSYMLVQAYDFWHLHRHHGVEVQLGGSDQWGNITAGVELIARKAGEQVHGVVAPLLTTASGTKFGKSEGENVWLDPERTSPYHFYQFWLNVDDADVESSLRVFTFLDDAKITAAMAEQRRDPSLRAAQRTLAWEVTALVHGSDEADVAARTSLAIFGKAADADFAELAVTMPQCVVSPAEIADGIPLVDLLCRAGLASSKADARRGLAGRGYSVNEEQVSDATRVIGAADLRQDQFVMLRKGKKNYVMMVVGEVGKGRNDGKGGNDEHGATGREEGQHGTGREPST